MRKKAIGTAISLAIVFIPVLWFGITTYNFRKYYGEAEPLVQTVWPLAYEMESYVAEHDTYPEDLDDIASFSPDLDLSPLEYYHPVLNSTQEPAFYLRVNDRHAFAISRDFAPSWVTPSTAGQDEPFQP